MYSFDVRQVRLAEVERDAEPLEVVLPLAHVVVYQLPATLDEVLDPDGLLDVLLRVYLEPLLHEVLRGQALGVVSRPVYDLEAPAPLVPYY